MERNQAFKYALAASLYREAGDLNAAQAAELGRLESELRQSASELQSELRYALQALGAARNEWQSALLAQLCS